MINKKAPKDMNAVEFVDYLINGNVLTSIPDDDSFIQLAIIKDALKKPAPNPFTPDQLAWMREEQRMGYVCAAKDENGNVCTYTDKPDKSEKHGLWQTGGQYRRYSNKSFLYVILSWNDKSPLYFKDYAPLEE